MMTGIRTYKKLPIRSWKTSFNIVPTIPKESRIIIPNTHETTIMQPIAIRLGREAFFFDLRVEDDFGLVEDLGREAELLLRVVLPFFDFEFVCALDLADEAELFFVCVFFAAIHPLLSSFHSNALLKHLKPGPVIFIAQNESKLTFLACKKRRKPPIEAFFSLFFSINHGPGFRSH